MASSRPLTPKNDPTPQSKYQSSLNQRNKEIADATKELTQLRETSNIYRKKLRDMELDNDGLENAER